MNLFKIGQTQAVLTVNGKTYRFKGLHSINEDNPRMKHLTRGSDGLDSDGIDYEEGTSQPIVGTFNIRTSQNYFELFSDLWKNKTRFDWSLVDTKTGSSKTFQNAILQQEPYQRVIDDTEDSIGIDFIIEAMSTKTKFADTGAFV